MKKIKTISVLSVLILTIIFAKMQYTIASDKDNQFVKIGNIYPMSGKVLSINREKDIVNFVDSRGDLWQISETDDWEVGDTIVCIMDKNGTDEIKDDIIIDIKYECWK